MPSRRLAPLLAAAAFLAAAAPAHAVMEVDGSGELDFGNVAATTQSPTLQATFTNAGDVDVDLGAPNFTSGTGSFTLDQTGPGACGADRKSVV